jgi:hypothetical protein
MFHIDTDNKLAFLESPNVKVFPSGRRKSELIGDGTKRYIPIDPEARLNTESNHRKHSGLNGYKQSYILGWTNESISLVVAGYLFNIKLSTAFMPNAENGNKNSYQLLGEHLAANLKDSTGNVVVVDKIYANILTTDVTFFTSIDGSGNTDSQVSTEILRDQSFSADPRTCLDLKKDPTKASPMATDFYFSGLSFSADPLEDIKADLSANQHSVSLQILTKGVDNNWHIYEPSRLPEINHGDTPNSVRIPGDLVVDGDVDAEGDVNVDGTLTASDIMIGDMKAITLEVVQTHKAEAGVAGDKDKWQLCFNNAKVSPLE